MNTTTFYYECRFYGKPTHTEKVQIEEVDENGPVQKKRRHASRRNSDQCDIKMKVVEQCDGNGQALSYTLSRTNGSHHLHDLDRSDQIKRNSEVRDALRKEAAKLSYSACGVE
ncbi:hypothetical protein V1509DRAFT_516789 [Lipomyces kononenkoae]